MLPLIMAGVGLAGAVGKAIGRGQSNRELRDLQSRMPQYKVNPLYAQRLGLAQTLLNARMPGAAAAERNIYQTQANQMAGAERAATDPNQLLLTGAGAAGQAGQAFNQLGQAEAQDYQRRYGNLATAQEAMAQEQAREYEDQLRRYQMQTQIQGAINENRQNMFGDISNAGFGAAYLGASGAFNKTPGTQEINPMGKSFSPVPSYNTGATIPQYPWMPKNWWQVNG